jgi:hypothetical protein
MTGAKDTVAALKEKARHEMIEYAINVAYLSLVFAAFTVYKRLVLAAYDIAYANYWVALIEAVILGKVIMIGGIFRLGRGLEDKPLIFATAYKTIVFCLFCAVFTLAEYTVTGLWKGGGPGDGLRTLAAKGYHELLGNVLVVFVSLLPFFGFKELGRVFGQDKVREIFFMKRSDLSDRPPAQP